MSRFSHVQWGRFALDCFFVVAYASLVFWASSQSSVLPPYPPEYQIDKVVHLLAFSVFGWLIAQLFYRQTHSFYWCIWFAVVLGGLYGIADEFHQSFVPGRFADIYDIYADICGSFVGGLVFWKFHQK